MIIDSHAHIIEYLSGSIGKGEARAIGGGKIRFLDGEERQLIPPELGDKGFSYETLIREMDKAHIDKAILLHGLLYGLHNDYYAEAIKKYPDRLKAAGSFMPGIDQAEVVLDRLIHHYGFQILKFEISTGAGMTGVKPELKLDGDAFEMIYQEAEKSGVTIVFDIGSRGMKSYQIQELVRAVKRHPSVRFVLCHLMAPNGRDMDLWEKDMQVLAKCENLWFDITALPWNIREEYPYPTCSEYVKQAMKMVGSERMIWGSDVPSLLLIDKYQRQYDYLIMSHKFTGKELDDLLCRTAQTVYGIF